jgi:hypothetical protein
MLYYMREGVYTHVSKTKIQEAWKLMDSIKITRIYVKFCEYIYVKINYSLCTQWKSIGILVKNVSNFYQSAKTNFNSYENISHICFIQVKLTEGCTSL